MRNLYRLLLTSAFVCLFMAGMGTSYTIQAAPLATSIDFETFTGTGFTASPGAGQIDSDSWAIDLNSAGTLSFGGTQTTSTTPWARGSSTGGVDQTGGEDGVWAFNTGGNVVLGVQPSTALCNSAAANGPCVFVLRLRNNTGSAFNGNLTVSYDAWERPDSGAVTIQFSHAAPPAALPNVTPPADGDYTDAGSLFTSSASGSGTWASTSVAIPSFAVSIPDGELYYVRWEIDTGSFINTDEVGLDNITINQVDPTAVSLQSFDTGFDSTSVSLVIIAAVLFVLSGGAYVAQRKLS